MPNSGHPGIDEKCPEMSQKCHFSSICSSSVSTGPVSLHSSHDGALNRLPTVLCQFNAVSVLRQQFKYVKRSGVYVCVCLCVCCIKERKKVLQYISQRETNSISRGCQCCILEYLKFEKMIIPKSRHTAQPREKRQ